MTTPFRVTVRSVRDGSQMATGASWESAGEALCAGRSMACDVVLADRTVSMEHAVFEVVDGVLSVTNRSERGATFVERRRLDPGERARVVGERGSVQLGGILLVVDVLQTTEQFAADLASDDDPPLLEVVIVADEARVRCAGVVLDLAPRPARALRRLAREPGEVVSHRDLLDAIDPGSATGNVHQTVTYLRNALIAAVERGELPLGDVRGVVLRAAGDDVSLAVDAPVRRWIGALVQSVRGRGYRLNLPRDEVISRRL